MIQHITSIGEMPWTREDMKASLPEFMEVFHNRPFKNNQGGMRLPHLFATWYMVKKLRPDYVVESGVWYGQGTWLIEQAVPQAKLFCIDINLRKIKYKAKNAKYFSKDFGKIDWSAENIDKSKTLLFFDDHQNALARVEQAIRLEFKHLIFEDNYPAGKGDCYSLKKAFSHAGYTPIPQRGLMTKLIRLLKGIKTKGVTPNSNDARLVSSVAEVYYEFPPVVQTERSRFGKPWTAENFSTPKPIFSHPEDNEIYQAFLEESIYYTWICYLRLRD